MYRQCRRVAKITKYERNFSVCNFLYSIYPCILKNSTVSQYFIGCASLMSLGVDLTHTCVHVPEHTFIGIKSVMLPLSHPFSQCFNLGMLNKFAVIHSDDFILSQHIDTIVWWMEFWTESQCKVYRVVMTDQFVSIVELLYHLSPTLKHNPCLNC